MDKRYQVFVSSTYVDLKEERRAVIQTLMEMDCIPAGMELFPSADEEQFSFIKKVIDDCDYYILIIGWRYGSTTAEGLSYTEKEYDYARDRRIPVLAFVHENPATVAPEKSDIDETQNSKLLAFREKVMAGKLVKLWNDPKELPAMVALSLPKTIKTHTAVGWVRANQVASSEVLAEINDVRKRNEDIERQLAELKPSALDLAGLDEMFTITGTGNYGGYPLKWELSVAWGEIFAALGPHILECPYDNLMLAYYRSVVKDIQLRQRKERYSDWVTNDEDFQTVKVQFMALKLVNLEMLGTVSGGQALFWSLTPKGHETLMQLRSVKTAKGIQPLF